MRRMHAKFHEFSRHRKGDINLSSFPFYEFCRMGMYTWLRGLQQNSSHIFPCRILLDINF
jgi:hypothetical protein